MANEQERLMLAFDRLAEMYLVFGDIAHREEREGDIQAIQGVAFEALAKKYLEFGVGQRLTREYAVQVIKQASIEALEQMNNIMPDGSGLSHEKA